MCRAWTRRGSDRPLVLLQPGRHGSRDDTAAGTVAGHMHASRCATRINEVTQHFSVAICVRGPCDLEERPQRDYSCFLFSHLLTRVTFVGGPVFGLPLLPLVLNACRTPGFHTVNRSREVEMLGVGSSAPRCDSWDMDHDRYQHYFYDYRDPDQDFYTCTAPSEDIWKKFELVPTPPLSPTRTAEGAGFTAHAPPGDRLDWVSQFVGPDEELDAAYKFDTDEVFGNLSSIIIQDCMWSGFPSGKQLEKVVSDRLAGAPPSKVPVAVHSGPNPCAKAQSALLDVATDCVDPAAVLTFPVSSCKKQASSGTESRTDSSDDEEIDVVTVENKQNKGRLVGRKPVTITVRADPHDPGTKRFHISIHQQQHNYAAPSPDSLSNAEAEPPRKRTKPESPTLEPSPQQHPQHKQSRSRPGSRQNSPQSSDCEDSERRKTHNYLERKRRNDLRSRFLALRDQIPSLADCPKTPKVVILTKAREYLRLLHNSERLQSQERKHLRTQQQQLLRKLAHLKRQNGAPAGGDSC
ncbi:protein L-Myc [Arapaima gigas]